MFPTSPPGLKRAIAWIDRRNEPGKVLVGIEGRDSYGSEPTRALGATELDLCEVRPPRRTSRAGRGKYDDIDALAVARTVLGEQVETLLDPRPECNREDRRILLNARDAMERRGTADRLILTALLRSMDRSIDARKVLTDTQVHALRVRLEPYQGDRASQLDRVRQPRIVRVLVPPDWAKC